MSARRTEKALVSHFLYFPAAAAAALAADDLRNFGFSVEVRESAGQWLVLASGMFARASPGSAAIAKEVERVALQRGGDYDGMERSTELTRAIDHDRN